MIARGKSMKHLTFTIVVFMFSTTATRGDEVNQIPLDQIWALRMPGTRNIGELETDKPPRSEHGALVVELHRALARAHVEGKDAKAAFAVLGTGLEALRQAHAVLVEKKELRETFPSDSEVSVVFFSYSFGSYVQIHEAQRRENLIEIKYRFTPHKVKEMTAHVAIIPLGTLARGDFEVSIIQMPMEKRFIDGGFKPIEPDVAQQVVSGSFCFSVQ